jgi:transcriptional regulator
VYIPSHFADADPAHARALIDENPFGMLIVPAAPTASGALEIAHIPFVLDPAPARSGPLATLRAHVARANPIGALLVPSLPVIAVFTGPHAYVSPRWYEAPARSVPTWNFTAVHAHGVATRVDDRAEVLRMLTELTGRHEAGAAEPWSPANADGPYIDKLLGGIVAFTIRIDRFETKRKLSQNRPLVERAGVIAGLRARGAPGDEALAAKMAELDRDGPST